MSHGHFRELTSQKMGLATQDDLHLAVCLTHEVQTLSDKQGTMGLGG